jgi:hypothetical protein
VFELFGLGEGELKNCIRLVSSVPNRATLGRGGRKSTVSS